MPDTDPEESDRKSRTVLVAACRRLAPLYLVAIVCFAWAYAAGRYQVFPFRYVDKLIREVTAFVEGSQDGGRRITFRDRLTLHNQEKENDFDFTGFRNADPHTPDSGYLLLSRFSRSHGQSIVELVRIEGFETLHSWIPPVEQILKQGWRDESKNSPQGYRAYHPLLLNDGGLVLHSGGGPLVRLNRNADIAWLIDEYFHHSIELDHEGRLVVPLVLDWDRNDVPPGFRDDGYAVVTLDGSIVARHSLTDMLLENGYRGLVMGAGPFEHDRYHLNDAQPILRDVGGARRGDVALSIRHLSTVLLYRPDGGDIVWLRTGPWLNQHDVDLLPDGRFSIFGNDMIRLDAAMTRDTIDRSAFQPAGEISSVYVFDPASGRIEAPYDEVLRGADMYSAVEGRSRVLQDGDVYIEDTVHHRLLRLSATGIRWVYVNGSTETITGGLNWCRYLTRDEVDLGWLQDG